MELLWIRRYKIYFFILFIFFTIQLFLAYKFNSIFNLNGNISYQNGQKGVVDGRDSGSSNQKMSLKQFHQRHDDSHQRLNIIHNSMAVDDEDLTNSNLKSAAVAENSHNQQHSTKLGSASLLTLKQLEFQPECQINSKEAISALQRAKTKDCKKHIATTACLIQMGKFYKDKLESTCPNGNYTAGKSLGCYKDEKEYRLLSGYFINLKLTNSPKKCIQICLQSGFIYAGLQYSTECFCGNENPQIYLKLSDPNCNMKCPGDPKEACGGYFTINIYETGIAKFSAQSSELLPKTDVEKVRVAYLLTLNGRALRQIHRLIKVLYSADHIFYIHVDSRQDYLFRELQKLEDKFPNVHLARDRFSTIWGGASLLTMLLNCMNDLLGSNKKWDFVINLSESDFPVKSNEKLVQFLTANKGMNFVKSHGRETQRFIQKQGLDKTFVECDTHMWRIGDRELPNGIQIDGGSDWIALSKDFVKYIIKSNELIKGLLQIFEHTLLPAESFFHTILRNSEFCLTYIDNNLHVTNWKRKLGCKCQYKHVVDWCGCSPNDFKPEDWARLQSTEQKLLFFGRKFEPIINQKIILQMEEWLYGPYPSEFENLNSYWQSVYNINDKSPGPDDAALTISYSLLRIISRILDFQPKQLLEITNFKHQDEYKGFLIRYEAYFSGNQETIQLETRIRPNQAYKVSKLSKLGKRIRQFEVSSDYDLKEQFSRNLPKFLSAFSDPVLSFRFVGSQQAENHSYNLTLLWLDPSGQLVDFNEIHVEDSPLDSINYSKANLKHPLTPGIWTVKLIGRTIIFAQTKFLVVPQQYDKGKIINAQKAQVLYVGSKVNLSYPADWKQYLLSKEDTQLLEELVQSNAKRKDSALFEWIDGLVSKFYLIRETCLVSHNQQINFEELKLNGIKFEYCQNTDWSSLAPDPKSDVYSLLNRR